jgi:hypothetical protein
MVIVIVIVIAIAVQHPHPFKPQQPSQCQRLHNLSSPCSRKCNSNYYRERTQLCKLSLRPIFAPSTLPWIPPTGQRFAYRILAKSVTSAT